LRKWFSGICCMVAYVKRNETEPRGP
jgi:hypothetical protein